ncbi:MAG: CHASE2 domain-containing protein [bacterium]
MKFFNWDYIVCTALLFIGMILFPLLLGFEMFEPMTQSLTDFRITDIVDSKMVQRDQLSADTNMILINCVENNNELNNLDLARVVNLINKCNPKVIGIKKVIEQSNSQKWDKVLSMVLSQCNNLVLSTRANGFDAQTKSFKSMKCSDDYFTQNAVLGFENFLPVKDERTFTIRSFIPKLKIRGKTYNSFAVEIAKHYRPESVKKLFKRNHNIEMIDYLGHYQFFRMEAYDVIEQNFEPGFFKNKIVIIGRISTRNAIDSNMALEDVFFTPLNDSYTGKAFPDMYGSIVHANIISMILNENYLTSMPNWAIYLISIIFVYFNMIIFTYIVVRNKKWYEIFSLAVFVIESILILAATIICFIFFNFEMNLTIPIFAIALSIIIYEIYHSSLKPLTIKIYYKFIHKGY